MDLKTRHIAPTHIERAAIDTVLGPPPPHSPHDRTGGHALLDDIGRAMTDASICGLGQTAYHAIESLVTLNAFGPDRNAERGEHRS